MSNKNNIEHNEDGALLKKRDSSATSKQSTDDSAAKIQPKQSFTDRWKFNRFWLIRASYHVLRTIWIIVMAIGAFIAWLISLLFI